VETGTILRSRRRRRAGRAPEGTMRKRVLGWLVEGAFFLFIGANVVNGTRGLVDTPGAAAAVPPPLPLWLQGIILLLFVLVAMAIVLLFRSVRLLDQSSQSMGPTLTYYALDERQAARHRARDRIFRACQRIVDKARRDIFALNAYSEERPDALEDEKDKARLAYLAALMRKSRRVRYTRVIQVNDVGEIAMHHTYLEHFRDMVAERQARRAEKLPAISLLRARPRYPSTFLIVDNEYLILQLNELDPRDDDPQKHRKERMRMRGVMIVHDPQGQFVPNFVATFWRAHDGAQAVELKDLGAAGAAAPPPRPRGPVTAAQPAIDPVEPPSPQTTALSFAVNILLAFIGGVVVGPWTKDPDLRVRLMSGSLLVFVVVLVWLILRAHRLITQMSRRMTPKLAYYPVDNQERLTEARKRIFEIVRGAKKRILALNSYAKDVSYDGESRKHLEAYLAELIHASDRVEYQRIVQLDDGDRISDLFEAPSLSHFRAMLDRANDEARPPRSPELHLLRASPRYPTSFYIIDKYLILQLNEIHPDWKPDQKKVFRMRGVVILEDPVGAFVQNFVDTFEGATKMKSRPVDRSELPEPVPRQIHAG
jgi:hypothetical protein